MALSEPSSSSSRCNETNWEECLNANKGNQLDEFDGEFDLREGKRIRKDIKALLDQLNISEDNKVIAAPTMRLIATFYSKKYEISYKSDNGWLKLLIPLILKEYSISVMFNLFEAIRHTHVPYEENCDTIIRILILYHDPVLSNFIVRKRVFFHDFTREWTQSLFAGVCSHDATFTLWNILFKSQEHLIFYLVLAIVLKHRQEILEMIDANKEIITDTLSKLPKSLSTEDIKGIFIIAKTLKSATPFSIEYDLYRVTFGHAGSVYAIPDFLCIPISIYELSYEQERFLSSENSRSIEFRIVDCRPVDQYNAGHLPNAINLDLNLHFDNPSAFADKVDELLNCAPVENEYGVKNLKPYHFCFMGSNRDADNYFIDIIAEPILKSGLKYVSILKHGYMVVHDVLMDDMVDHDPKKCFNCNPDNEGNGAELNVERQNPNFQIVSVEEFSNLPQLKYLFECIYVLDNGKEYKCKLTITDSEILVLRLIQNNESMAYMISTKSLANLLKITSSKQHPQLVTIHYGSWENKQMIITETQTFIMHDQEEVAKIISTTVLEDMRKSVGRGSE